MDNATDSFARFGPAEPASPVILAVPHAGRIYPEELIAASALPRERLEALEDRFADLLIGDAVAAGTTAFVARRARAWIDLNRDQREIDPAMVAPSGAPVQMTGSARVRGGLGLIPRRIAGQDIYRRRLTIAEIETRIREDHHVWHGALGEALARARARFGVALLIDCHSMPPIARSGDEPPPRIVIGDRYGRSASSRLVDRAESITAGMGLRHARNSPYAGGYALDRHGRPARDIHAIQIEIDRSLYLAPDLRSPGAGVAHMRAFLATLIAALVDEALPIPPALAAE
jgi:N-formylglutamate amidohydrolase